MTTAAIVLAAGKGTRMKSELPKVLHEVAGQPMLAWVLAAVRASGCEDICLVLGPERDGFAAFMDQERVHVACQENRLGTGDAVASAVYCFAGVEPAPFAAGRCVSGGEIVADDVLICLGDTPAVDEETLKRFVQHCQQQNAGFGVLGMQVADPTGYGRLVQDQQGDLLEIVEHKDADEATRAIEVCNTGIMYARTELLFKLIAGLKNDNVQGEYYLTDCVAAARAAGERVAVTVSQEPELFAGVNDRDQLAAMDKLLSGRQV